jgi:Coenzyme PQQ synthesis protein D (PqqD)
MTELHSRPSFAPDLRVSAHNDGAVILDIREGQVFSTNKVGARILALIGENACLNEIVDRITTEFEAPRERVEADLGGFIDSLVGRGLVRCSPSV